MKHKLNIWWKLVFISATLDLVAVPTFIIFHIGDFPEFVPIPLWVVIMAFFALPVAYLMIFSLWHWRTRYAGRHHLGWPILFVLTAWPLFSALPGSILIALVYFVEHILPDARGKGAYGSAVPLVFSPPATPLPKNYQLTKSACFVLGWALIIQGALAAVITCIATFAIWNVFEDTLPSQIGETFTKSMSNALWCGSQVAKVTGLTSALSALAVVAGAVLVQISQRLRWRLLDEQEKDELRKSI